MKNRIFCSTACKAAAQCKTIVGTRRMLHQPDHPLAGRTGLVAEARAIVYDRLGPGWHPCQWCGKKVRWRRRTQKHRLALIVDHVDHNPLNNDPSNLVAACVRCNAARRYDRIRDDELFIVRGGTRRRAIERVCATCGQAFLFAGTGKHTGVYCSLRCLHQRNRT